ncbi:phosphate propanoyltransferase [Psychrobacillus soli]|uniref:Phosphate propanoyltransferase n=1 Tax=Psychrobacillus soli TaxID=1543965 RepID=A0A544SUB6_9BACI|nr:phosphate propanoyltransferase [Psychrobacillus soli]TQR08738.1 phosphate propanoyltransferase [Psychrobacillus soli]
MDELLETKIMQELLKELSITEQPLIPIGVSARHCHLSEEDFHMLFGNDANLTVYKNLLQPGQYAANETILIAGPRGSIEKVRILGPFRKSTQVEVSYTDALKLGVKPPIRQSGDIHKSAPITLVGPKGGIYKEMGLIIAQSHIHMSPDDAQKLKVVNGETVTVEVSTSLRRIRFMDTIIRISPDYVLEMHIDTDEANAGNITENNYGRIIKEGARSHERAPD